MDGDPFDAGTGCGDSFESDCTAADTCNGIGICQDNHAEAGAACGSQGVECVEDDACDGEGLCEVSGPSEADTACGDSSSNLCTDSDTCDGAGTCEPNDAAVGAPCGSQGVRCVDDDACDGAGTCVDGDFHEAGRACGEPTVTECSDADSCDGAGTCDPNDAADGTQCTTDPCGDAATCDAGQCICSATTTLPPTTTTTMPPDAVCNEQLCAGDETLAQQCETFVAACLAETVNEDDCVAGGLFICEGGACGQDACSLDETLEQECRTFLDTCITPDSTQPDVEACIGAAILMCQEEPISDDVCDQLLCIGDETRSQQCETFVAACLANEVGNEEECAGGGLFICSGGVCGGGICAGSETLEQECRTFLVACLAAAGGNPRDQEACIVLAISKCSEFNP